MSEPQNETQEARVRLKPKRDESLRRRHAWVFSGAVERVLGSPGAGDTVVVESHAGEFLARAAFSPASQIRLRVWSFAPETTVDAAFMRARLEAAIARRHALGLMRPAGACRLVYAEADGLPGLIVDRYGDVLQCQFLAAGAERWREPLVDALNALCAPAAIYERSVGAARRKEGLASRQGLISGAAADASEPLEIGSVRMLVEPGEGQKTGAYLDQQLNYGVVAAAARGARVLDAFSYTGAFALHALAGGAAHATLLDSSPAALAKAERQAALNGVAERCTFVRADAFDGLRELERHGERFDLVILDPPKFVHNAGQVRQGTRAYKDVNRLGFALLRPGGRLATFSCSGHVGIELFQKTVASAAAEAGRGAVIERLLVQAPDHPVALEFPESLYLKGLLLQAD